MDQHFDERPGAAQLGRVKTIQGIPVEEIARTHGTPLYVYDGDRMIDNLVALQRALPSQADVCHTLAANPNMSVVALLRRYGACAEVRSPIELEIALRAGVAPLDIVYRGQSARLADLERALDSGVYALVVDSTRDLLRAAHVADKLNQIAPVILRVQPRFAAEASQPDPRASQSGLDQASWQLSSPRYHGFTDVELLRDARRLAGFADVDIRGIHASGRDPVDSVTAHADACHVLRLFERVERGLGRPLDSVVLGDGFVPPLGRPGTPLDSWSEVAASIGEFIDRKPGVRLLVDGSRSIARGADVLVSQVSDIRGTGGERVLILDTPAAPHLASASDGTPDSGRTVVANLSKTSFARSPAAQRPYRVVGSATTLDPSSGLSVVLPRTAIGDLLVIARDPADSPLHIHGHPAEVLVVDGEALLVREHDSIGDILRKQRLAV